MALSAAAWTAFKSQDAAQKVLVELQSMSPGSMAGQLKGVEIITSIARRTNLERIFFQTSF
jgi:hypothetical protein